MTTGLEEARLLEGTKVKSGERWIYVADFNIKHEGTDLKGTDRIDAEIADLKQISDAGGIVAILAHKGRHKDGDTEDLGFVAPYLSDKLGVEVKYYPENTTVGAMTFMDSLQPGDVAIMGNVRRHKGEEENDPKLAECFAKLGTKVAVGGFGKAHREHASNVGILAYLPGYATRSQIREIDVLKAWAGRREGVFSVAVLGGIKKEKITIGLAGFAANYDVIIPGGIVLHTILKVKRYGIGLSVIKDGEKSFKKEVKAILKSTPSEKICIPRKALVARKTESGYRDLRLVDVKKGVPDTHMIVSYIMPRRGVAALDQVVKTGGRLLVAGTPDIYSEGLGLATAAVVEALRQDKVEGVVLGGDTVAELKHQGATSTGGGSALYFAAHGTTCVFEALKRNKRAVADDNRD